MRLTDKLTVNLLEREGLLSQMNDLVPVPKFMCGTSTTKEFDKMVKTVFMPDEKGIVSASFGLSIAASNPALREFFDSINRPLPPTSGFGDDVKGADLLEQPSGVVTEDDRIGYINRLKEFISLNSVRPKKKEE